MKESRGLFRFPALLVRRCGNVADAAVFANGVAAFERGDCVQAVNWFREAARSDNLDAEHNLGVLLLASAPLGGDDSLPAEQRAVTSICRAASEGHARAQFTLAFLYAFGIGMDPDAMEAMRWYRSAVAQRARDQSERIRRVTDHPDAHACFDLGCAYLEGEDFVVDEAQGAQWIRRAAEQGNVNAQKSLSRILWTGQGVDADESEALEWCRKAAANGDADAQYGLGGVYYNGTGVRKNKKQALRWWREAATRGHEDALRNMVTVFADAEHAPTITAEMLEFFRKAADEGRCDAQFLLGCLHSRAGAVAADDRAAVDWWRRAAEQGHSPAQFCLAMAYLQGTGVARDDEEGVVWLGKAASSGHSTAQYWLGVVYLNGRGVTENPVEAYMWMLRAAAQGEEGANEVCRQLADVLTEAELAAAHEQDDARQQQSKNAGNRPDDLATRAKWSLIAGGQREERGDWKGAAEQYRSALALDVCDRDIRYFSHNNLGYSLNASREHAEAFRHCLAAIAIGDVRYNAHKNLALACQGLGMLEDAALCFVNAIVRSPKDPRAGRHLHELLESHPDLPARSPELAAAIDALCEPVNGPGNVLGR